jgi:hypothetical protein
MDRARRLAVLRRDGFRCQACRRKVLGQVHHIFARGQGGSDALCNLVTLCGRCHMLVSPIAVTKLMAYFKLDEREILVRRARVELAIHTWVLSNSADPQCPPSESLTRKLLNKPSKQRRRAGCVWNPAEDSALLEEFDAGLSLEEIATRRRRGVFAVQVRLHKLGRNPAPATA